LFTPVRREWFCDDSEKDAANEKRRLKAPQSDPCIMPAMQVHAQDFPVKWSGV
jgi:hypothetical protein